MSVQLPETIYREQIEKYISHLGALQKIRRRLGWLRFILFVLTITIAFKLFSFSTPLGIIAVIIGMGTLLYLVSLDIENNKNVSNTKTLIALNQEEIELLHNNYQDRDDGNSFADPFHYYANDLDLFGPSSLFQYINRGFTDQGRQLLAHNLLEPLPVKEIYRRHEAIKELSSEHKWRQQFQAYAMQSKLTTSTQKKITNWLMTEEKHFTSPYWKTVIAIWTIVSLCSLAGTILGYMSASFFSSLFLLFIIVSGILTSRASKDYADLSDIIKEINTVFHLLNWIETKTFNAPLLLQLKQQSEVNNQSAAIQIKRLSTILNRFDILLNMIASIFLNSFLLWGPRQMLELNSWRKANKTKVAEWFDIIASFETINSLAVLHFNQPEWVLPKFTEEYFTLKSLGLGHPLIPPSKRVLNNFNMDGLGKTALITGSNMAGKSTFLRTLGVNILLAQMGSPVCAKTFLLSPIRLMTSMRIADNLAENTSTFYAELKKLKTIIDAVNQHEIIFILLDEILRGTNSMDRHTGSKALITQLIKKDAVAVIATHDLELAALKQQFPTSMENYHFDVQVEGEELYFDYRLKEGVCTSLNASILMKKIGIDLSSNN